MSDWFSKLAAGNELPAHAASELEERGFVVFPGMVPVDRMKRLAAAYTIAVTAATGDDVRVGSTSTKVSDFVNRDAEFDDLYVFPPLLEACCRVIDWPLLGFILMVDDFRPDNGTTRFVPGSHRWSGTPEDTMSDVRVAHEGEVLACAGAGSLLVFNGSAWHGHTANRSNGPRRSIQGAFIPRDGRAATDFAARMQPETRARLGPVAKYVLAL
jgi:hypothetical protein